MEDSDGRTSPVVEHTFHAGILASCASAAFRHAGADYADLRGAHVCDKINADRKIQRRFVVLLKDALASCTEKGEIRRWVTYSSVDRVTLTSVVVKHVDRPAVILSVEREYGLVLLPVGVSVGEAPVLYMQLRMLIGAARDAEHRRPGELGVEVATGGAFADPRVASLSIDDVVTGWRLRKPERWQPPDVVLTAASPKLTARPAAPVAQPRAVAPQPVVIPATEEVLSQGRNHDPVAQDAMADQEVSQRRDRAGQVAAQCWEANPESLSFELKRENLHLMRRVAELEAELQFWRSKFLRSPPRGAGASSALHFVPDPEALDDPFDVRADGIAPQIGATTPLREPALDDTGSMQQQHGRYADPAPQQLRDASDVECIWVSEFVSV